MFRKILKNLFLRNIRMMKLKLGKQAYDIILYISLYNVYVFIVNVQMLLLLWQLKSFHRLTMELEKVSMGYGCHRLLFFISPAIKHWVYNK